MKSKNLLLLPSFLLFAMFAPAQKTSTADIKLSNSVAPINQKTIESLPFSKGVNLFTIQRNFEFTSSKPAGDNAISGHNTDVNLNIDYNHFIVDKIGVGVEFDLSSSSAHYGSTSKTSDWMAFANIIYGSTVSDNFNLYGKFS